MAKILELILYWPQLLNQCIFLNSAFKYDQCYSSSSQGQRYRPCQAIMATMACLYLPIHRADIGVYAKNRKKCRSTVKTELKHLHKFKSYGQNKIVFKIQTICFCSFTMIWHTKYQSLGGEGCTSHRSSGPISIFL